MMLFHLRGLGFFFNFFSQQLENHGEHLLILQYSFTTHAVFLSHPQH